MSAQTNDPIPLVERALGYGTERTAILATDGRATYAELLELSARVARNLLAAHNTDDLRGGRVAYLVAPSLRHVAIQWGIFRAGGAAVPLCVTHPAPELAHVLDDAKPAALVADLEFEALARPLAETRGLQWLRPTQLLAASGRDTALPQVERERPCLLIYTSGTTGKPKAAVTTHAIFEAQMQSVAGAWQIEPRDHILHALPLHHLHGVLNALSSVLYAGGTVEILPRFEPSAVWSRLAAGAGVTLFMGVPTMYDKLAAHWDAASEAERARLSAGCRKLRLMVSGSAALPIRMMDRFRDISGHVLLERYGMTEIGMALGNPLEGERRPGSVGVPFPGVEARLVETVDGVVRETADGPGELQIRGPSVFAGYFERPEATREAFTPDGFFRTGDVAVRERGYYRLLGRASVDIIKTGGYKVSALEIEDVLREHPAIAEVSVVGLADDAWGERVAAAVVLRDGETLELETLRAWAKERLAPYKVPSLLRAFPELPRNPLGKVVKPALKQLLAI